MQLYKNANILLRARYFAAYWLGESDELIFALVIDFS